MKVIIIGCNHGGTATATTLKKNDPSIEVSIYERNDNLSFLSCGIALGISGTLTAMEDLFYASPESLAGMGISVNMRHDVQDIDYTKKVITAKDLATGKVKTESYDKLVFGCGSWPITPTSIPGIDNPKVMLCKNYDHAKSIVHKVGKGTGKEVIIIGAGYIGVELAEAYGILQQKCTLIDGETRIMSRYLDKEFTDIAEDQLKAHGVNLRLGEFIASFEDAGDRITVKTNKGAYTADRCIFCIGFRPVTDMILATAKKCGLAFKHDERSKALVVDEHARTNVDGVYAIGDCATVIYNPCHDCRYIPLATNAIRMGAAAAYHMLGNNSVKLIGTQGTSGIKIHKFNIASTGLTETTAEMAGIEYDSIFVEDVNRPGFMPTNAKVYLKLVFEKKTRRLIGGQIMSEANMTMTMNVLSVCIQNNYTLEMLAMQDFFFQPHFNAPWNNLNVAALAALNKK